MNTFRSALFLALAGLFGVSANPAFATLSTALLDWENLEIFALGVPNQPAPTFSLSDQATAWRTSASTVADSSDTHEHNAFNWTTALDIKSETPNANADANASDLLFSTSSSATEANKGDPNAFNQASARLTREAVVTVSGPAAVIFSVPYSIEMDGELNDFANRTTASVGGTAAFVPTGGSTSNTTSRSFTFDSTFSGPVTQDGSLFFGLVIDGAGVVNVGFTASTSAQAPDPVPEPSVVLGLVAGLIGVGAALRRRMTIN